jgi:hypothetical protein
MGMAPLAAIFFELEKMGRAASLDGAGNSLTNATHEFKRVRDFLATQPILSDMPTTVLS